MTSPRLAATTSIMRTLSSCEEGAVLYLLSYLPFAHDQIPRSFGNLEFSQKQI